MQKPMKKSQFSNMLFIFKDVICLIRNIEVDFTGLIYAFNCGKDIVNWG